MRCLVAEPVEREEIHMPGPPIVELEEMAENVLGLNRIFVYDGNRVFPVDSSTTRRPSSEMTIIVSAIPRAP